MKLLLMRNNILREDLDKVIELLRENDPILTNGPRVREFEQRWSEWLGWIIQSFVSSGSAANLLSMTILKLRHPRGWRNHCAAFDLGVLHSKRIAMVLQQVFCRYKSDNLRMCGHKRNTEAINEKLERYF